MSMSGTPLASAPPSTSGSGRSWAELGAFVAFAIAALMLLGAVLLLLPLGVAGLVGMRAAAGNELGVRLLALTVAVGALGGVALLFRPAGQADSDAPSGLDTDVPAQDASAIQQPAELW